jgi:hypothetical protein
MNALSRNNALRLFGISRHHLLICETAFAMGEIRDIFGNKAKAEELY